MVQRPSAHRRVEQVNEIAITRSQRFSYPVIECRENAASLGGQSHEMNVGHLTVRTEPVEVEIGIAER